MSEFQKKRICKEDIYKKTKFVCQIAELKKINKTSDSFSVFAIQRDNITIISMITNDGRVTTQTVGWNK